MKIVMNAHRFNQLANIHVALSTLQQFNQYVWFPFPEKNYDNPIFLEYFLSPLDSSTEKKVEKIVCIAAAKYVFDNPNIPDQNKEQTAKNTARDIREVMRYAKLEYLAKVQNLPVPEYNRRKQSILIVKRVAKIKKVKEILKIKTITDFATIIAGPVGGGIVLAVRLLWPFVPITIKEEIISVAKEKTDNAIKTINNCIDTIKSTELGKKLVSLWSEICPSIHSITDKIQSKAKAVTDIIKSQKKYKSQLHEKGIPESIDNCYT